MKKLKITNEDVEKPQMNNMRITVQKIENHKWRSLRKIYTSSAPQTQFCTIQDGNDF